MYQIMMQRDKLDVGPTTDVEPSVLQIRQKLDELSIQEMKKQIEQRPQKVDSRLAKQRDTRDYNQRTTLSKVFSEASLSSMFPQNNWESIVGKLVSFDSLSERMALSDRLTASDED